MKTIDPENYWYETDRRQALEQHHDATAAREVNADWLLTNSEPFGTRRRLP